MDLINEQLEVIQSPTKGARVLSGCVEGSTMSKGQMMYSGKRMVRKCQHWAASKSIPELFWKPLSRSRSLPQLPLSGGIGLI